MEKFEKFSARCPPSKHAGVSGMSSARTHCSASVKICSLAKIKYGVRVQPGCDGRGYTRSGMRCSVAHSCDSSQHDGGCMAQSFRPSRYLLQSGATREAAPTATPCRGPARAPFQTDRLTPP